MVVVWGVFVGTFHLAWVARPRQQAVLHAERSCGVAGVEALGVAAVVAVAVVVVQTPLSSANRRHHRLPHRHRRLRLCS